MVIFVGDFISRETIFHLYESTVGIPTTIKRIFINHHYSEGNSSDL